MFIAAHGVSFVSSPGSGTDIVRVSGPDPSMLDRIASELLRHLKGIPGMTDVYKNWAMDTPEIKVRLDHQRLSELGLTGIQAARSVQQVLDGQTVSRLRGPRLRDRDIVVRYAESDREYIENLENVLLQTPAGVVPLREVARLEHELGPRVVTREEGQPTLEIHGFHLGRPLSEVVTEVGRRLESFAPPPGYQVALAGEQSDFSEARARMLRALLLSGLAVYLILVIQFQSFKHPLTVMSAIPLQFIGVGAALIRQVRFHAGSAGHCAAGGRGGEQFHHAAGVCPGQDARRRTTGPGRAGRGAGPVPADHDDQPLHHRGHAAPGPGGRGGRRTLLAHCHGDHRRHQRLHRPDPDRGPDPVRGFGKGYGGCQIDVCAFSTLALNAAIEGARAGGAGRGFAVVADEVRKLAEKTMIATKEVEQAIHGIQSVTQVNAQSVDQSVTIIQEATGLANESGKTLERIVELVGDTSDQVSSFAATSEEQSAASEEINRAISEVNQISDETAEGMDESASVVNDLAEQAQELQCLVEVMAKG
jgi:hypothetical protein